MNQVPDECVGVAFCRNQQGREAFDIQLSIEAIRTLASDQPCYYINRNLKSSVGVIPSPYWIAFDNNRISEHVVPALTIQRLGEFVPILGTEIDPAETFGSSQ